MPRLRVVLFVLLGVLVLILGLRAATRWRQIAPATYLVAKTPLASGQVVQPDHLARVTAVDGQVPAGALVEPAAVIGRKIQKPRAPGEPLAAADFQEPRRWLVDHVPAGRVALSLRVPQTVVPYRDLRYGDHVDLLVQRKDGSALLAGRDAIFLGFSGGEAPASGERGGKSTVAAATRPAETRPVNPTVQLILGVHPEDVFPLSTGVSAVAVIVHGAKEVEKGALLPIEPPAQVRTVEVVAGARREQVMVP